MPSAASEIDGFATTSTYFGPRKTGHPNTSTIKTLSTRPDPAHLEDDVHSPVRKRLRRGGGPDARNRLASEEEGDKSSHGSEVTSPARSDRSSSDVQILTSPGEGIVGNEGSNPGGSTNALQDKLNAFQVDSAGPSSRASSMSRSGSAAGMAATSLTIAGSSGFQAGPTSRLATSETIQISDDDDDDDDVEMQILEEQSSPPVARNGSRLVQKRPIGQTIELDSSPPLTRPALSDRGPTTTTTTNGLSRGAPREGANAAFDRFVASVQGAAGSDFPRDEMHRAFVKADGEVRKGMQMLVKGKQGERDTPSRTATATTANKSTVSVSRKVISTGKPASTPVPTKGITAEEIEQRLADVRAKYGSAKSVDPELRDGASCLERAHFDNFAKLWARQSFGLVGKDATSLAQYRAYIAVKKKGPRKLVASAPPGSPAKQRGQVQSTVNGKSFYGTTSKNAPATKPAPIVKAKPAPKSTYRKVETSGSILERQLAAAAQLNKPKKKKNPQRTTHASDDGGSDGGGADDGAWDSDGSVDAYDDDEDASAVRESEEIAVEWFNTCAKEQLMELAGCTPAQADLTITLRPFADAEDFRYRTRKQKGVGNGMLDSYLEVVAGMEEVDRILRDCEKIGADLAATMKIWTDAGGPNGTSTGVNGQGDVGLNLVSVSDQAVVAESSDPTVRSAFQGYLWEQPEGISKSITLKDYQLLGVNWLNLLYRKKLSCILADEMGLGKTAQVIALLSHLKANGESGPHLVVVPSSTLDNWRREFNNFAPDLVVESYYGSQAEREELRYELRDMPDLDVVVTTYNQATSSAEDHRFLRKKMHFKIAIFDEGHMLKNSESKKHKDLMQIRAQWRLLLTGTPLQNNLQELVSLLSFILPDQFRDSSDSLRAIFKVNPGQSANLLSRERTSRAKKMMTPFVLRRKKAQVLKDLPKKLERIEWCEMTDLQREVYLEAMNRSRKALLEARTEADLEKLGEGDEDVAAAGAGTQKKSTTKGAKKAQPTSNTGRITSQASSSHVLMDLRKAASHPMLFRRLYDDRTIHAISKDCLKELEFVNSDPEIMEEDMSVMTDFELHRMCLGYKHLRKYALKNDEWMSAGKLHYLQDLLPKLRAAGDRVLLFSQFTMILDILEVVLDTMGIRYLKLTGQTNVRERQTMVDHFSSDPQITVFLLSTRAGGLGLNLTAANTVIFYDQDYNPHNDKQAEDRSYRIGQTRDVNIIKLITRDSLEEDMLRLATDKLKLDSEVSASAAVATDVDGDANVVEGEKKTKKSLLSDLKKKFAAEQEASASQMVGSSSQGRAVTESPAKSRAE